MRMQKLSLSFFVLIALLAAATVVSGQTVDELQIHVEYLASDDLEGRLPASEGMEKAIEYVKVECKKLGLQTYSQPVSVRGGTCNNTVAVLSGVNPNVRIVIGAHLDHIGKKPWGRKTIIYNGADDNASGCAMVLAMAKNIVAKGQPACTVEFHFYTGEEQGLLGSKTYVKKPVGDIEQYRFMINLDMVGRLGDNLKGKEEGPNENGLILPTPTTVDFSSVIEKLYDKYEFAQRITWYRNTNDSDHASWWKVGVPAVILHTGIHKDYHQGGDEADRIDYEGMVEVTKYALDIFRGSEKKLFPNSQPSDTDDPYILH